MSRPFRTKDAYLAVLLRFELGRDAHAGIAFDENGSAWFEFGKPSQCAAIKRAFCADEADTDFATGYAVSDARKLLQIAATLRRELGKAREQWRDAQKEKQQ